MAFRTLYGLKGGVAFSAFVEENLVGKMHKGEIVVCDDFSTHDVPVIREMIGSAGAELQFLPPCSLELNPIEMTFSHIKSRLKKTTARTREDIEKATASAIYHIRSEVASNYFVSYGYGSYPTWFKFAIVASTMYYLSACLENAQPFWKDRILS